MRKALSLIVSLVIVLQMVVPVSAVTTTDYDDHWAKAALSEWNKNGVIKGYPDGSMKPDNLITRGELIQIVDDLFKFDSTAAADVFTDIKNGDWYSEAVNRAYAKGFITGYPDGSFKGNENMTREHAVLVLYNAFKMNQEAVDESFVSGFSDSYSISGYALEAVEYFEQMGYVSGYADGMFKPGESITRAEIIKIIDSIVDLYCMEDGEIISSQEINNGIIVAKDVVLDEVQVNGTLYISESVGDSDVTLDSVVAKGNMHIEGGGANSIHIIDSEIGFILVDKKTGETLRIVVEGKSTVDSLVAKSGIILEDKTIGVTQGILKITVDKEVPAGSVITLLGDFLEVNTEADSIDIVLEGFVKTLSNKGLSTSFNGDAIEVGLVPVAIGSSIKTSETTTSRETDDWTMVWSDEFDGTELDLSKWSYETGNWIVDDEGNGVSAGWGNEELQYYTDNGENTYLEDGKLVLKAQIEDVSDEYGEYGFTSGKITSIDLFSKKYGKFEAKMKLPEGQGLWPAFWMMPQENTYGGWASSGEIDIMEAHGSDSDSVGGTIHYGEVWPNNKYSGREYEFAEDTSYMDYHVYGVEWEPGEIRWYVDGELYSTQNNWYSKAPDQSIDYSFPAPFDHEFYFILNLAVGGWYDGDPADLSIFPAEVYVDYVRAYELTGRDYMEAKLPEYAPEELPADAKVELGDGNLVYNSNYDGTELGDLDTDVLYENISLGGIDGVTDSDYWYFLEGNGGDASLSIDAISDVNYARVEVVNAGSQSYAIQLIQDVSLATGNYYTLSFDAKASGERDITVKVGGDGNDEDGSWTAYAGESFTLTDEVDSFEYTFQMAADTDLDTRLEFNLGLNASTAWIGNVRLEAVDPPEVDENAAKEPQEDGNHVYNGTFDQGDLSRMSYWNLVTTGAEASASVDEATRELEVTIADGGANASAVQVNQMGIKLKQDSSYTVAFMAKADAARSIQVGLVSKDGNTTYMTTETIDITTEMTLYERDFVMSEATDVESKLIILVGGDDNDVMVDNVSIIEVDIPAQVDTTSMDVYPLANGNYTTNLDSWDNYAGDGAVAAISVVDREAQLEIGGVGVNPWSIQFYQDNLEVKEGIEYVVAFDIKSTQDRDFEVTVENASYTRFLNETVAATSEYEHHEFSFTMDGDETVALKFLLGKTNSSVPSVAHDVVIDNVFFEMKNVLSFDDSNLTYTVMGFDGAESSAIVEDPTDDTNMVAKVIKNGGQTWAGTVFGEGVEWDAAITDLPFSEDRTKMSLDVYSPTSGITVNLKLEDADGENAAIEVSVINTKENEWETLVFDLSEAAGFSVDNSYNKPIVFLDFGNVGTGETYYFDNFDFVRAFEEPSDMSAPSVPINVTTGGAVTYNTVSLEWVESTDNVGVSGYEVYVGADLVATTSSAICVVTGLVPEVEYSFTVKAFDEAGNKSEASESFVTTTATAPVGYTIITNGTFDADSEGWSVWLGDGSDAEKSAESGLLKIDFPVYAGYNQWSTQVYQDTIDLIAGTVYELSFEAYSSAARDVWYEMTNLDGWQNLALTTDTQIFTAEFTAGSTTSSGKINFLLGTANVAADGFTPGQSIYIDNVSIVEK